MKDVVFACSKCEHQLFVTNGAVMTGKELVRKVADKNCPNCGEEGDDKWTGLWRLVRLGDYEKEHEE